MAEPLKSPHTAKPHNPPSAADDEVLTPTEARQASSRQGNLRVLIASLVTLGVLGAGMLAAFFATSPQPAERAPAASPVPAAEAPASTPAAPKSDTR